MLEIYLNDHLAGATAARELARRAAGSNRGTVYALVLEPERQRDALDPHRLLAVAEAFA